MVFDMIGIAYYYSEEILPYITETDLKFFTYTILGDFFFIIEHVFICKWNDKCSTIKKSPCIAHIEFYTQTFNIKASLTEIAC